MHSTTRKLSTAADRASVRAAAVTSSHISSSGLTSDSEEESSSSSAPVSKRGRHGKAPLRAAPPTLPDHAEESDLSDDGGADVPRGDVTITPHLLGQKGMKRGAYVVDCRHYPHQEK